MTILFLQSLFGILGVLMFSYLTFSMLWGLFYAFRGNVQRGKDFWLPILFGIGFTALMIFIAIDSFKLIEIPKSFSEFSTNVSNGFKTLFFILPMIIGLLIGLIVAIGISIFFIFWIFYPLQSIMVKLLDYLYPKIKSKYWVYLNNIEVLIYLVLLISLIFEGVPYLYSCKEYTSQLIIENPNSIFSFKIFLQLILNLFILILPSFIIVFVTIRILNFPDLLLSAICYTVIALIYLYSFIDTQVHSYWYSPNIMDVLINPISNVGEKISNDSMVISFLKLIGDIIKFIVFYVPPIAFLFLIYKKIRHYKYFEVAVSLFFLGVISYILVYITFEYSNSLITNGIAFDFNKSYLVDLYILVILIIILTIYFYFIAPLLSYLMCMLLLKDDDYLSDKLRFLEPIKLNIFYLLFIFTLNISLGKLTKLHFPKIPTAYPGEILKSDEELERQEENNNMQDDYPR